MGLGTTVLLGFFAGVTILLGLPIARLRRPAPTLRTMLNAVAIGVLLFLLWDVLSQAWEPIDGHLADLHAGHGGLAQALGYGALFVSGLAVGLLSLVGYERWMARRARRSAAPPATAPAPKFGPGAMGVHEARANRNAAGAGWSPARHLALLIAIGIGLHNFAEGLAIGQSAANNDLQLATMLVIGFGLHNATEGFGITAPMAGERAAAERDGKPVPALPGWGFLMAMGLIGGGPTFLGTILGHSFTSEPVSVVFLTLAAGSIVYVVGQLFGVAAKARRPDLLAYGLLIGMVAGFLTDAVVTAAGA